MIKWFQCNYWFEWFRDYEFNGHVIEHQEEIKAHIQHNINKECWE